MYKYYFSGEKTEIKQQLETLFLVVDDKPSKYFATIQGEQMPIISFWQSSVYVICTSKEIDFSILNLSYRVQSPLVGI